MSRGMETVSNCPLIVYDTSSNTNVAGVRHPTLTDVHPAAGREIDIVVRGDLLVR